MSSEDVKNLLEAFEGIKRCYVCCVCSELCRDPVTLSKCFHMICAEHFADLKTCPKCSTSLDGCTTYPDHDGKLAACIKSTIEMDKIFDKIYEGYRTKITTNEPESKSSVSTSKEKSTKKPNEAAKDISEPGTTTKAILLEQPNQKTVNKSKKDVTQLSSVSGIDKSLEKKNIRGETMLQIACRLGIINKVTELLEQGANTNTKNNAGWTPLHEAVRNGQTALVNLLLQFNTFINVPGQRNDTPLHIAIRYNRENITQMLVKHGADIHVRNCKGETPFQLASAELKTTMLAASENIIQTQSVNITHNMSELYPELESGEIRVYCISESLTVLSQLKRLAKSHSNLHIETKSLTKEVTHLIVDADDIGVCEASLEVLQGVVNSAWILTVNWVTTSNIDKLEPFHPYEVKGIGTTANEGPKNSRFNKYKQLPGIFDGCHFYFHNFTGKYEISKKIVITREILIKLITDAGGVHLRRAPNPESITQEEKLFPYHAKNGGKLMNCSQYIIFKDTYEPMYNMQHVKALPISWLIECIEKFELCEWW